MKVKGIKKAVGDYRRWINSVPSGDANILLDISTGEVWTDCYLSSESWKSYGDKNIISLSRFMIRYQQFNVTMDVIKSLIISLIDDGIIPYFEVNYRRK